MKIVRCGAVLAFLLAGCGDSDQYVGQWVFSKNECSTLNIVKNGSDFIVNVVAPGFLGLQELSLPGSVKDGKLYVESRGQTTPLFINKSNSALVSPSGEYHRRTDKDKDCAAKKK